jgi:HAMP domain-containing protein
MNLKLKFNLVLGLAGLLGIGCSALFSQHLLQRIAREEVLDTARVLMTSAIAVRSYTAEEIKPLLMAQQQQEKKFLPQTVPAYSAHRFVAQLQKKLPDYTYKEATLNPTNPADRAQTWEAEIVDWFKSNDAEKEFIGERDSIAGHVLYLSHPIKITDPGCLACHDTPSNAPKTLLATYGKANGFGWKLNDVVGAQIVSVPMQLPLQRAEKSFYTFLALISSVFVLVGILLNIMLHFMVTKRIINISTQADKVSLGELDLVELPVKGHDEVSSLGQSFNRMHRSLVSAFYMLEDKND